MLHLSDYDLAGFIVHILALPVLIGCVIASTCLLTRWVDASRQLLIVYNAAVLLTFVSFALQIAYSAANASIDYSNGFDSIPWRPLLILGVFDGSFDFIFRVATFALVAYLTVVQTIDLARHRVMKFSGIAAVLILTALTIIYIAFRGVSEGYSETYDMAVNFTSDQDYADAYYAVDSWRLRIYRLEMAFDAIYLAAVFLILVASSLTRNRPLSIAILLLLAIAVLETVYAAWTLYIQTSFDDEYDSDGYVAYAQSEFIVEIFLQGALLVTLLFAPPRPLK